MEETITVTVTKAQFIELHNALIERDPGHDSAWWDAQWAEYQDEIRQAADHLGMHVITQ